MRSLGLCTGASSVSLVTLQANGGKPRVVAVDTRLHEGNPEQAITNLFQKLDLMKFDSVAVTGRRFREFISLAQIPEPLAVEHALGYINGDGTYYNAIVSAGGETFIVYQLDANGKVTKVYTGNKCASGTGEFFIQQIRRMNVEPEEAVNYGVSEDPYFVSGRCSVFCKSDCTHATNKGIPKGQVVAGLSKMMAKKILELLKNIPKENIIIVGGTTRISVMMNYLQKDIRNLVVPREATYFEALGAALWALENRSPAQGEISQLISRRTSQFDFHQPLRRFEDRVTFKTMQRGVARRQDRCILGLDVGSTTTKAVLLRESDDRILAGVYLRTNGDPVGASRECYRAIQELLGGTEVLIRGLGVTGSGRKIAGLHALTEGVINEIIAHAVAALYFDREVDTIFEIGGQDAKYTYITNGVASDYAMNEACSAGTGSFLEESARETLGIEMEAIAGWAMRGSRPPNFNDQCAAFISSDIKNTFHEGIPKEDIVAGLVYSICMNYVNRVKGARPVGNKVFMQGGVCYNRAVPIAMAALSGKEIIVPPEPGLMGAYGVALEVKSRLDLGLLEEDRFDLQQLIDREVSYRSEFTCTGGREKCDLGCAINRVVIEGKTYPFGGACNLYYNLHRKIRVDAGRHDLVVRRQELVYRDFAPDLGDLPGDAPTVGISRSLLMNTFYPLFAHFFVSLGFRPRLAEKVDPEGIELCAAPFCYPCEISHGYFKNLLDLRPDYVFIPHISGVGVENGYEPSNTCPLLQGENYYLRSTFEAQLPAGSKFLSPVIDLSASPGKQSRQFQDLGAQLGVSRRRARAAFRAAREVQQRLQQQMLLEGKQALQELEQDPERTAVVLFGRSYNAYVPEANKGIPHKFASRGITIIPVDFLDLASVPVRDHMYWALGQINLKGACFVKEHPQLFGTFITNFSCGPDSFIVGYFRDIMGKKPSLTLELDNHTADAGLETRVEAFLDIVARYRKLDRPEAEPADDGYQPAAARLEDSQFLITTSSGEEITLFDPRVRVVFASMNPLTTQAIAAAFRSMGIRSLALPPMDAEHLKIGRGNSSCKECLPLTLTTGALVKYLRDERPGDEVTVYFVPTADGPCRFGQYQDFMRDLVRKQQVREVAFLSMSSKDGYGGLGTRFTLLNWNAIVIADIFEDIHNAMLVISENQEQAHARLQAVWSDVLKGLEQGNEAFMNCLPRAAEDLRGIPRVLPLNEVPQVLLVGEIYVRKEGLSRRWLPERLAPAGIVTQVAPIHEWIYYVDWLVKHNYLNTPVSLAKRVGTVIKHRIMFRNESRIKEILASSGWYQPRPIDIDHIVQAAEQYLSRHLLGEAVLTIGGPLVEVGTEYCGAIAIGPFGCMPNRLSESILNLNMDREHLLRFRKDAHTDAVTRQVGNLPFLAIESDGNPFPQLIEARLETFIVQALRTHAAMRAGSSA